MIMSKKIDIVSPGICIHSLWDVFHRGMVRHINEVKERRSHVPYYLSDYDDAEYAEEMRLLREYYGMNGYDDSYDDEFDVDDDGTIIFPIKDDKRDLDKTLRPGRDYDDWDAIDDLKGKKGKKCKHKKHRSRHKSNGCKVLSINTPYSGEEGDDENEYEFSNNGKIYFYPDYHDKYDRIEFDKLMDFDEYCNEEGYVVPPYVGEKIAYAPVAHCCLNPVAKEHGILEIMAEESYGDMRYEACDESELGV